MKKFLLITLLLVLMAGFIFRFGSALFQEGNPVPILITIGKLELSNSDYEQFAETDKVYRYVSKNTGEKRLNVVKEFMKQKGWDFVVQMGSGLVFNQGGQTIVIVTRLYSKHYFLWNVPIAVY